MIDSKYLCSLFNDLGLNWPSDQELKKDLCYAWDANSQWLTFENPIGSSHRISAFCDILSVRLVPLMLLAKTQRRGTVVRLLFKKHPRWQHVLPSREIPPTPDSFSRHLTTVSGYAKRRFCLDDLPPAVIAGGLVTFKHSPTTDSPHCYIFPFVHLDIVLKRTNKFQLGEASYEFLTRKTFEDVPGMYHQPNGDVYRALERLFPGWHLPTFPADDMSKTSETVLPGPVYSLGELLRELASSEYAYNENMGVAAKYEAKSSPQALWWKMQAKALRFQPDPSTMPGVDELEANCDAEWGLGLTSKSIRTLRGRVSVDLGVPPQEVDKMPLTKVVQALRTSQGQGTAPAPKRQPPQGKEQDATDSAVASASAPNYFERFKTWAYAHRLVVGVVVGVLVLTAIAALLNELFDIWDFLTR